MWLQAAGAALLAAGGMTWAVRGRSSSVFGPSVWRGPGDRPSVALTFDDGPSESTPQLLEVLAASRVAATFFVCGENVRRLPGVARAIVRQGHEIGNHTDSHERLDLRSPRFVADQIRRAQESIIEITGVRPALFRAPFGVRWFGMRRAQRELGLLGVMWTVNGLDWKLPAEAITARLVQYAQRGAIIGLHDGRSTAPSPDIRPTLEAVRRVIPDLSARGFRFETVSQILCPTT